MSIELKIKSKHLAEEARIIRFEERKLFKQFQWAKKKHYETGANGEYKYYEDQNWIEWYRIGSHRKFVVRNENRATFLARAYIAGIPYSQVEQTRKKESEGLFQHQIIPRIASMVAKYGNTRMPKTVWQGSLFGGKEVPNPAFIQLKNDIKEWSKI